MSRIIFTFLILIFLSSCKRYKLRQPTSIEIQSTLSYAQNGGSSVSLTSGTWYLDRLRVDGDRKEGEDVSIEREYFDEPFDISNASFPLDIPVGEYQDLRIRLKLDVVNNFAMRLTGFYNGSAQPIPFIIDFENDFIIEFPKEQSENLILEKKVDYSFQLQYDHSILFGGISQIEWESANLTDVNGVMTVIISKSENDQLFDIIDQAIPSAINFVSI